MLMKVYVLGVFFIRATRPLYVKRLFPIEKVFFTTRISETSTVLGYYGKLVHGPNLLGGVFQTNKEYQTITNLSKCCTNQFRYMNEATTVSKKVIIVMGLLVCSPYTDLLCFKSSTIVIC